MPVTFTNDECPAKQEPRYTMTTNGTPWAVLLAGGDGMRLKCLTERITGDSRPKQFCCLHGDKSLLSHTRERIKPVVAEDRTLFVLNRNHECYYRDDLRDTSISQLIRQPANRGTGVAIATAVLRILKRDSDATVIFSPCDSYYSNDAAFRTTLRSAISFTEKYRSSITILGATASSPETEYGWIEPGPGVSSEASTRLQTVLRFTEKPSRPEAVRLYRKHCLWNTFVTVGRAETYLELLRAEASDVVNGLLASAAEDRGALNFSGIRPLDFSRDIMVPQSHRLLVIRDSASGWADLGHPARVLETFRRDGITPFWLAQYHLDSVGSEESRGADGSSQDR